MAFLQPLAFLLAVSLGVLLWLWRFQQRRHTIVIPSLIPFEELPERQPRWSWPRVNWLFWLQTALLLLLMLGSARWVWYRRVAPRPSVDHVLILDTSASMRAVEHGRARLDLAKQRALGWARQLTAADRVMIWTTAPAKPLSAGWVQDHAQTRQLLHAMRATDMPGALDATLTLAAHATDPRRVTRWVVVTDEPQPSSLPQGVTWLRVGQPTANVAITGFELHRPLLTEAVSRDGWLTIWNAADRPQRVTVRITADQTAVTTSAMELAAQERRSILIASLPTAAGALQATIDASRNALASDDTIRVAAGSAGPLRVAVAPALSGITEALRRLTPRVEVVPSADAAQVYITDQWEDAPPRVPTLTILRGAVAARPVDWTAAHPVMRYLDGLDRLSLAHAMPLETPHWAEPVAWAIPTAPARSGRSFPCVVTGTQEGIRRVVAGWDLAAGQPSDPAAADSWILLFNTLEWLSADTHTTLVPTGALLPSGDVTTLAGPYTVEQGGRPQPRYAYLADPREMNTMQPASTWAAPPVSRSQEIAVQVPPTPWPVWWWCWVGALAAILLEWLAYWNRLRRQTV